MIGSTILHYNILEKLGEGGMGEVYKARDTKLDRFVALKFLPSTLTTDEEQKARFIQEAKTASAMNHPNICTIYSIEEYDNDKGEKQLFIAMEYVEGETLKDKKDSRSEKQKLEISVQVAEGLAAAHEKGIVHRDIKPENIMIRKDGIAQIMDFGLAKLYADKSVSRLTKMGTTVGTLGYMSPEQVQGLDVDHRTDIFSFGVVLYEMFAGESPFKGMHETAIMYEIVNVDAPPLSTIINDIDPELDRIILECLEKDKDERCQSAKELAKDLRKIKKSSAQRKSRVYSVNTQSYSTTGGTSVINKSGATTLKDIPVKSFFSSIFHNPTLGWTAAVIITVVFLVNSFLLNKSAGISTNANSITASIDPPANYKFAFDVNTLEGVHLNVSPDGTMLAFVAQDSSGKFALWVRQLNSLTAQKLNGTDGAFYPFWSYDSKYIAYFADGKLKKILSSGGPSITICIANSGRGGSWNQNDVIVFAPDQNTGMFEVPASGGEPKEITKLDTAKGESTHRWPCFLPDGNNFIFYSRASGSTSQEGDAIYISSLDGKEIKKLFTAHSNAIYAENNILYVEDNTLMAQPFDPDNLKLTGSAVPIEENVLFTQRFNCAVFSVSRSGEMIYQSGNTTNDLLQFAWYDRNGKKENVFGKPDDYRGASLSPDETKIAVVIHNSGAENIWLYDIKRNIYTRFTFSSKFDNVPSWSPDRKWIVFTSNRKDNFEVYMKSSNGIGNAIQLTKTGKNSVPFCWSSDNKYIGFSQLNPDTKADVYILPIEGSPDMGNIKPKVLLNSKFDEYGPLFSPDNKWVLYSSDESGQYQLYASPFPNITEGKWQVSTISVGENYAGWTSDGKGIYYQSASNKLIYIEVNTHGSEFNIGKSTTLFDVPYSGRAQLSGVSKDNKHFLLLIPMEGKKTETPPLTIVTNWYKKLIQKD